jgi:hypothetical protein
VLVQTALIYARAGLSVDDERAFGPKFPRKIATNILKYINNIVELLKNNSRVLTE